MISYQLEEDDPGYGGPYDGRTRIVAYFTSITRALEFMTSSGIEYNYEGRSKQELDLDKTFYFKREEVSNLGRCGYRLKLRDHPNNLVDPKNWEELTNKLAESE